MAFFRPAMLYVKSKDCLMVMSAGNDNKDARNYVPQAFAAEPELRDHVIVVGACDADGDRSSFSNYGNIVEIYAPGGNAFDRGDTNSQDVDNSAR
jgi:serine protease